MMAFSALYECEINEGCELGPDDPGFAAEHERVAAALGAPSSRATMTKGGYEGLGMIQFFTAGADEVKCWTIFKGIKAPQAAGVVDAYHEDDSRGVSRAAYADVDSVDFSSLGPDVRGVRALREAGLFVERGAAYEV